MSVSLLQSTLSHLSFAHESMTTPDTVSDHTGTSMAVARITLLALLWNYMAKLMPQVVFFNLKEPTQVKGCFCCSLFERGAT